MMQGLLTMIVFPSLLGMALYDLTRGKVKQVWGPRLAPLTKVSMALVVSINASVIAPYLRDWSPKLFGTAIFVLGLATLGYLFGFMASRLMRWNQATLIAVTFNSGMRNISAGAVLAIAYFPASVAVPVVLGMLFQQSLASVTGYLLHRRSRIDTASLTASGSAPH
jgi:BASS family bile acid:Na+ symporter